MSRQLFEIGICVHIEKSAKIDVENKLQVVSPWNAEAIQAAGGGEGGNPTCSKGI